MNTSTFLLPGPADGEFSLGYLGRLTHLNLARSVDAFARDLIQLFGITKGAGARLKVLAKAAKLTNTDFLRSHTLAPAIVCGKDASHGLVGGHIRYPCPDQRNPMKLPEATGYFCETCLSEQLHKYGFGYWHRVHQLPGVYWCPWHKSPLLQCQGRFVLEKLPSWEFDVNEASAQIQNSIDHPILNRYNEVIIGFLNGPGPIDELKLFSLLTMAAKQKGINTEMWASEEPFLSDIAFDSVPQWWLRDVVDISQKTTGVFFMDIDDAVSAARVGTRIYALATAILLDEFAWEISAARRDTPINYLD